MRHLRIVVNLWILLPLSTAVKNALDTAKSYVLTAKAYAHKMNEGYKNEENTVTATYDVVTHKGNNYVHIILDLGFLLPLTTAAMNAVEAAKPRIKNMIQYATQPTPAGEPDSIRIHAKYHICKHRPPYPRFDVRQSEPCEPEVDVLPAP